MKLKKIASLMLAGVMAVSMLAGCSGNTKPNPDPDPDEGNTTGYSSTFAGYLSKDAKKSFVTFADNSTDAAALKDALGNMGSISTAAVTLPQTAEAFDEDNALLTSWGGAALVIDDFADTLDLENPALRLQGARDNLVDNANYKNAETVKFGMVYVIDGTVDVNKALKQVADKVEGLLEDLPNANDETAVHYTYDYTVSVSVVNQALAPFAGYSASANFIAVTVTRVPTAA